jgi:hypothetical protein
MAHQHGFGLNFFHMMLRRVKDIAKIIHMTWLMFLVFLLVNHNDRLGDLLLVVSHLFAVPI